MWIMNFKIEKTVQIAAGIYSRIKLNTMVGTYLNNTFYSNPSLNKQQIQK